MSVQKDGQGPGKLRVVMAQLDFLVGDIPGNTQKVIEATRRAEQEHQADLVCSRSCVLPVTHRKTFY